MSLSDFASLLKEEKKKPKPVVPVEQPVQVAPIEIKETENLKSFLQTLAETKKKQKQELKEKSVEVLPKLGDFFSLLADSKHKVEETAKEVAQIDDVTPEITQQKKEVSELIDELKTTVEVLDQKKEEIEGASPTDELRKELDAVKKTLKGFETRIAKEFDLLKKSVASTHKISMGSGGGGEVRFERLDDVSIQNPEDGDAIVFNGVTGKYINVPIRLSGGTSQQMLVKLSDADYDYEWQDMNISIPAYTKLIDDATTPTVTYIGEATPGSSESASVWRIQKIQFDGSGNVDSVKYASAAFDQSWLSRVSLTYS